MENGLPLGSEHRAPLLLSSPTVPASSTPTASIFPSCSSSSDPDTKKRSSDMTGESAPGSRHDATSSSPISFNSSISRRNGSSPSALEVAKDRRRQAEIALLAGHESATHADDGTMADAHLPPRTVPGRTFVPSAVRPHTPPMRAVPDVPESDTECPRHRRIMIWSLEEPPTYTPAADWSLTAPPLPSVPDNELNDPIARQTISDHSDLFAIPCRIHREIYEDYLTVHPNVAFVSSVCGGLREGYWPSAITGRPGYPTTWDNSHRDLASDAYRKFVDEQCQKEIDVGRFSAAWEAEELYPGMYSMPIGVVPKPNSDKLRLITDHSAGKFSLNSMIPKPTFDEKVQLDNVQDLGRVLLRVRREHPGRRLVLFKSDVSEAYRQMPMSPYWQRYQVVSIGIWRMVDRCNVFGGCRSGNIWCAFMSLVLWIGVYIWCLSDLLAYSDDTFSWEFAENMSWYAPYSRWLPTKQARLLELWDELGIPHQSAKQIWGSPLEIIGFLVDANLMHITLSAERRAALVAAIRDFISVSAARHRRSLRQFQALAGWIQWSLNVFPLLRPGLSQLYAKTRGKSRPNGLIEITRPLCKELAWLANHIERADGVFMLDSLSWHASEADLILYTDASKRWAGRKSSTRGARFLTRGEGGYVSTSTSGSGNERSRGTPEHAYSYSSRQL